jgi:hypothetical protein
MASSDLHGVASIATEVGYRQGYAHGYEQAMHDMCVLGMLGYERPRECWNWLRDFLVKDIEAWTRSVSEPHAPPKFVFPPSWSRQRSAARARDGNKCVPCGSAADLECDHVQPVTAGGFAALDNLRTTCATCHRAKTQADKANKAASVTA